ncbi:MAG: hypothetical protein F6K30_16245 [Cyanothece sp. SIO2G6]|nr:hypothetical protein [Cyanothece sp. SIO2G6]
MANPFPQSTTPKVGEVLKRMIEPEHGICPVCGGQLALFAIPGPYLAWQHQATFQAVIRCEESLKQHQHHEDSPGFSLVCGNILARQADTFVKEIDYLVGTEYIEADFWLHPTLEREIQIEAQGITATCLMED